MAKLVGIWQYQRLLSLTFDVFWPDLGDARPRG